MGNVLRALNKSTDRSATQPREAARVVSVAVAQAEQAIRETLDAEPIFAETEQTDSSNTTLIDNGSAVIQEALRSAGEPTPAPTLGQRTTPAQPGRVNPLRRSAFFSPMILTHHRPRCQVSEQIRHIRTTLLRIANGSPVRCMITSSQPQEGKTVTATNLAYSFSEITQKRTLLIDADLRRGSVASLTGMTRKRGLAELLAGECSADEAIWSAGRENFHVLTAGTPKLDQIGEMLSSDQADQVMSLLAKNYEHIIIDSPPVISVADAGILGQWINMALLAVRIHKTHRKTVEQATQILEGVGVHVTGVVALDPKLAGRNYYRYANYY